MGSKKGQGKKGNIHVVKAAPFLSINLSMATTPWDFRVSNCSDKSHACVFPGGSRVSRVFPGTCTAQALERGVSIPLEEAQPGAAALQ